MSFAGLTELEIDPAEVAVGRTALALNAGPIRVADPGPDWGDAQVQAQMAQLERGEAPVAFRVPNRQVRIPLLVGADPASDFDDARVALQQKVGLLQAEGGWLKRGEGLYADVVNAVLNFPDKTGEWIGVEADVVLTLECIPDFYGDEIDLLDHVETSAPELVWTSSGIKGDYPGRLRIVVDNDQATDQLGLLTAIRSRHYDSAATAKLAYPATDMTPMDAAASGALTGAVGGNAIRHAGLPSSWTPVFNTDISAAMMTHQGTYRVFARLYTTSVSPAGGLASGITVRWAWAAGGDLANSEINNDLVVPGVGGFFVCDLGEMRLDATLGTSRWQGQLQAMGEAGGENLSCDYVWLLPVDEGFTKVVSSPSLQLPGFVAPAARDAFNQTVGALAGKTADVGGLWAGGGDADDFTVDGAGLAKRVAVSDTNDTSGRREWIGAARAGFSASVDFSLDKLSAVSLSNRFGLLFRYIDPNNYAFAGLEYWHWRTPDGYYISEPGIAIWKVVGAATTLVKRTGAGGGVPFSAHAWYTLSVTVTASGSVSVSYGTRGAAPSITVSSSDPVLATGGALASGKMGLYDAWVDSVANNRYYDNFYVAPPTPANATVFASRSIQAGTDGCFRQDAAGAGYVPIVPVGDNLRIPPSGVEGRTVQFIAKLSRGDFGALPDSGIDDLSAHAYYRPSWLFLPELPAS